VGLGYIAESLKNNGIEVSVLDMNLGYGINNLLQRIRYFKPDLIGFTGMTLGYKNLYKLINKIKQIFPHIKIVVGGAHLSAVREHLFEECIGADYGIILEGEISLVNLCKGHEECKIKGLIYRQDNKIVVNPLDDFISDLDLIPFPKYETFELNKYPLGSISIITSRGCPYDCIYCSVASTIGKKFRIKSAQKISEEIEYWYKNGFREFFIVDDNFTFFRKRVEEICKLIEINNMKGLHLKCPNGVRADKVDKELLKIMRQVGFDFISFGVEATSNEILGNLKKSTSIEIIETAIKDACDLGFDVDLFFLIGSPGETIQDVERSFALAQKYPLRRAIFYNLIPLPATELLNWLIHKKYLTRPLDDVFNNASYYLNRPFFFTPEMSLVERKKIFKKGQEVTLKIRRKYIERKLRSSVIIKRIFSLIYTLPLFDDLLINNLFIVRTKETLKRIFANRMNLGYSYANNLNKKVLFFLESYYCGGVDTFTINLINNWPYENDEIILVCNRSHSGLKNIKDRIKRQCLFVENTSLIFTGFFNKIRKLTLFDFFSIFIFKVTSPVLRYVFLFFNIFYLKDLFQKLNPDRMMVINGGYPGGDSCRAASISWGLFFKKPLSIHNYHGVVAKPKIFNFFQEYLVDMFVSRYTSCFITVSKASAELMTRRKYIYNKNEIKFIHNGISMSINKKGEYDHRDNKSAENNGPLCLMMGNYNYNKNFNKGHYFLLSAFKKIIDLIPDAKLLICGHGSPKDIDKVRKLVTEFNLSNNVVLSEFRSDINEILGKTDILLISAQVFESFGFASIEAMAHSVPIVSTDVGAIPEIVINGEGGYCVERNNVDLFANQIIKLLKNDNLRKEQGQKGFQRYEKLFKADRMAKEYADIVYNKI
jgi:radical SAM superfamily enzyme YgiQ (UPF0313 family)